MNWIQSLYETYENCQHMVGYTNEPTRPLLPICHITVQAHIEVVIDGEGNFRRAQLVDKRDATTIIPATESSAGRSGNKPTPHPFSDKLQYLAGDFVEHGGKVTSGFAKDPEEPYRQFVTLLTNWCNSPYGHPKARAVLTYVQKKTLMQDLITQKILLVDGNGNLISKKEAKRDRNSKDIFSVLNAQTQDGAVVRWIVETPNASESKTWRDATLWESWANYYLNTTKTEDLCMVTGQRRVITFNHPKFIRREGDNAKLISANDKKNFTFRGRFTEDRQACTVSLEASQKAHYALAWLISRQGYRDKQGELAVVAWATSGAKVPQPTDDFSDLYGDLPSEEEQVADTAQDMAIRLKKAIAGYRQKIDARDDVVVMAVDSATPGRLAIVYYRTLKGSDFLDRIENWHKTCAWQHKYVKREKPEPETGKMKSILIPFYGAPAPADIAEAAYGTNRDGRFVVDDRLKKATIKRLLPCIVDGHPIPRDLVDSVVRRASNRIGMEDWQWEKALSIACALYRKYRYGKEKLEMALDETRTSRDYLYGRLLAIADVLEERALSKAEKNRPTNAARYMQQFSQRPFTTWKQIHELLTPYFMRLGGQASYYKKLIGEVEDLFTPDDFISNKPLSGEYLLGYYCQRQKMWEKTDKSATNDDDSNE
ncbi:MAG: type I-C CRISPR-associated protein Cas8c/Csd1 [Gammaproteobacteria bacterium]|nr:MAG: type I-C CRISPR-associated protein Cas8c/Csd1 [Gammaproteobacteria bacterium]